MKEVIFEPRRVICLIVRCKLLNFFPGTSNMFQFAKRFNSYLIIICVRRAGAVDVTGGKGPP